MIGDAGTIAVIIRSLEGGALDRWNIRDVQHCLEIHADDASYFEHLHRS